MPLRLADGIWQLTPNGEGSILVEFKDYVVMVEGPISDAVTMASIDTAKRLAPGKPIKYVINTHHHADHAGGLRAYVAEGIPILTHESHRKYYEEQIFRNPHSLNPDRLARMPRAPAIDTMKDKRVLTDALEEAVHGPRRPGDSGAPVTAPRKRQVEAGGGRPHARSAHPPRGRTEKSLRPRARCRLTEYAAVASLSRSGRNRTSDA